MKILDMASGHHQRVLGELEVGRLPEVERLYAGEHADWFVEGPEPLSSDFIFAAAKWAEMSNAEIVRMADPRTNAQTAVQCYCPASFVHAAYSTRESTRDLI